MNSTPGVSRTSSKFSSITHVVFDLDGTLIDTESIYSEIYAVLCKKYKKNYTTELNFKLLGVSTENALKVMIDELKISVPFDEFYSEFKRIARRSFGKVELMPGAGRLIEHFREHKIPMAIATNSPRNSIEMKLRHIGPLIDAFSHIVTIDDVTKGKPDPEIYLLACSKFPKSPKSTDCLAFEDSIHGLNSAIAAGMQCVMTPDEHLSMDDLKPATLIIKTLEEFKPELFGLPPF